MKYRQYKRTMTPELKKRKRLFVTKCRHFWEHKMHQMAAGQARYMQHCCSQRHLKVELREF